MHSVSSEYRSEEPISRPGSASRKEKSVYGRAIKSWKGVRNQVHRLLRRINRKVRSVFHPSSKQASTKAPIVPNRVKPTPSPVRSSVRSEDVESPVPPPLPARSSVKPPPPPLPPRPAAKARSDEGRTTLLGEIQHAYQEREKRAKGSSMKPDSSAKSAEDKSAIPAGLLAELMKVVKERQNQSVPLSSEELPKDHAEGSKSAMSPQDPGLEDMRHLWPKNSMSPQFSGLKDIGSLWEETEKKLVVTPSELAPSSVEVSMRQP